MEKYYEIELPDKPTRRGARVSSIQVWAMGNCSRTLSGLAPLLAKQAPNYVARLGRPSGRSLFLVVLETLRFVVILVKSQIFFFAGLRFGFVSFPVLATRCCGGLFVTTPAARSKRSHASG
jgi:hypothetical protein